MMLNQISLLTQRVKDLEKEKDDINTEMKSNIVKKYEDGFKEGYNQFKKDMEKLQEAFDQQLETNKKDKQLIKELKKENDNIKYFFVYISIEENLKNIIIQIEIYMINQKMFIKHMKDILNKSMYYILKYNLD